MIAVRILLMATSCLVLVSSIATATDVEITGRYGGTNFSSAAGVEYSDKYAYTRGCYFVELDGSGPEVLWRLRPLVSYEYHWSGEGEESGINTQSNIVCLGLLRSFALGHARTSITIAAAHFSDTYDILVGGDDQIDYVADAWGISVGTDFRFKFFDRVDAVIGYKFLWREKPIWETETLDGMPYHVKGREGDHCISTGVSVTLGSK